MTAIDVVEGRSERGRRPARAGGLTRVSGLGLGLAMLWFSLLVLIPLTAVVVSAADGGWSALWRTITNEQTAAAIRRSEEHKSELQPLMRTSYDVCRLKKKK